MRWGDFWMFSAEMQGREPDPTRFYAEQMKYAQDVNTQPQPSFEMPGTYADPNNETTGAVTSS